jgi:hypothetical protein
VYGVVDYNSNSYRNMVMNAIRMTQGHASESLVIDEKPNANATRFVLSFERL